MSLADLVSVVIPCYNCRDYVSDAISSVINQSYDNVEIIVIDDGSTDDSFMVVSQLKDKHKDSIQLFLQENQGPYPARNFGISKSNGEYIAFLDADDYWRNDFLEAMVNAITTSDADLVYCGWQNIGLSAKESQPYLPVDIEKADKVEHLLSGGSPWPIHAALVRKEVLSEVGGYDLSFSTSMDYDLWLRIAAKKKCQLVPKALAYYRFHGSNQISANKWKQVINGFYIKKKFIRNNPELVKHISNDKLFCFTFGFVKRKAYDLFWRRDLISSQKLFRFLFFNFSWNLSDLKYVLISLLPRKLYLHLVSLADDS